MCCEAYISGTLWRDEFRDVSRVENTDVFTSEISGTYVIEQIDKCKVLLSVYFCELDGDVINLLQCTAAEKVGGWGNAEPATPRPAES